MKTPILKTCFTIIAGSVLVGCATPPPPFDYTDFKKSAPRSILVLPPLSNSPDINASNAVLTTATSPLAEAGYYVPAPSLVAETFRENGLSVAADIHSVAPMKLREIFGTDAAAYLMIQEYGTKYAVLSSETKVAVEAKLVDLKTGTQLWSGRAAASSKETEGSSQGGLAGLLVKALVNQIVGTLADAGYDYSRIANARLFNTSAVNGLLPGPMIQEQSAKPPK